MDFLAMALGIVSVVLATLAGYGFGVPVNECLVQLILRGRSRHRDSAT